MKFDLKCEKHPEYKAKVYPPSRCDACRTLFYLVHDKFRVQPDGGTLVVVKTRKKPVTKS
jgi:hypothetical protein